MFVLKRMQPKQENFAGLEVSEASAERVSNLSSPTARSLPRGWLESCANPGCHSGWLHPWRKRFVPIFEQGWTCSSDCTRSLLQAAVARELSGRARPGETHRHRIPLGLVMLEQGWISPAELQRALTAQRAQGNGRLGQWLMQHHAASEETVARALGLQWSCPVLNADPDEADALSPAMPRLFVDAFGVLPLRLAIGRVLYIGFEESLDPALALAVQEMTGFRVESVIVPESQFRRAHAQLLKAKFPAVELIEAASQAAAAHALARCVERALPVASRLVRVHDCLWLRMWLRPQLIPLPEIGGVEDVICSVGRID
jgi:hypothetical protein